MGRRVAGSLGRWLAVGFLLLPLLAGSAAAGDTGDTKEANKEATKKESRPVVDATRVYFGQAATCKAPAVVDADRVYRAIPEYRKILEKSLTEKDAEYSMLRLKATRKFRAAVEAVATDGAYDLVAAKGSVTWEGHTVPDVTDASVRKVGEQAK
jgi:hypothetical protein